LIVDYLTAAVDCFLFVPQQLITDYVPLQLITHGALPARYD
jgi:hypothetical protein